MDGKLLVFLISDALELGSSKMPSIDHFHDIDPMLSDDIEQPDDCLLAICDVTVEEFELLCGSKIQDSDGDTDDWDEIFLFSDLYYYIFLV